MHSTRLCKQWRIKSELTLPNNMGAEGWDALSNVASNGKVKTVRVNKSALRVANDQQVEALWRATDDRWCRWDYDWGIIAKKSEGDAGLQKLLAFKQNQ